MLRNVLAQRAHTQALIISSSSGFKQPVSVFSKKHSEPGSRLFRHGEGPVTATAAFSNLTPVRGLHQSCSHCGRFWESNPRGEYWDPKLRKEIEQAQSESWYGLKNGFRDLREEVGKWAGEWKHRLSDDTHLYVTPGDKEKIWHFNSKEALKSWDTLTDSDHNEGFSRCELTLTPTGKALFHGFSNMTPPKDGRIKNSGYCTMKSKRPMKSFQRKSYLEWTGYTHLIMRIRGDGRQYLINLSTAGYYDITWNDQYHYVLYTRGGPYWQYVKIPFSKFVFGSKGRIQDMQDPVPLDKISSFQLLAARVDGPFCLEIDWIGIEMDLDKPEEFAYETYNIPKFIAGV